MHYVRVATSLGRSGLQDWLLQRLTAVILFLYFIFWVGYYFYTRSFNYTYWKALFNSEIMRIASVIVLFSLLMHAWIGIWTVCTDYLKNTSIRLISLTIFGLALLCCLLWGFKILWSI